MIKSKRNIAISLPVTGEEEWQAVKEPLMSGWLTAGPKVREFEEIFAQKHGVKHAIAVTSATTALHLALLALDIGKDDEVIVPAFTWIATANVVLYCGATPVFCDIDPVTFNMDPKRIRVLVTNKTKAIIPVHLFGLCANMDAIRAEVPVHIKIIEDAACAAGSIYQGIHAGGLGDIGCFSFHPRKSVTCGEGGMITTNDDRLAELMSMMRNHGASISEEQRHHGPKPYILPDFNMLGYNYRMTDIQAAVGVVQIKKLELFIEERNKWANYYSNELAGVDWLNTPVISGNMKHGWQSYTTMVLEEKAPFSRNQIMEKLLEAGISTRPGTHAVHMLDYYKQNFGFKDEDFPMAKLANNSSMAIPLHNRMTKEDYQYVVEIIKNIA